MNNKTLNNIFKGDKVIWMVFFFLCVISVVEVFSASSELTYKGGNYMAPILKHMALLLIGIVCMVVTLNIKCKYFKIVTPFMIIISLITLLWVFVAGQSTNGAQRWIALLGFQFQPSEIAKGTVILATAQILSAMQTDKGADKHAMGYIIVVWLMLVPLIMVENLSTAALLSLVVLIMMVVGRVPGKQLGKLLGLLTLAGIFVISVVWFTGKDETQNPNNLTEQVDNKQDGSKRSGGILHRMDTWKARINKFVNHKELAPNEVDLDKDAQVAHANIAIATANYVGKGPGNSVERDFLSQAFSDFIYAIIIEEMGIEGALFVALLYIILLFRTGRIASRCENNFPAFLAMGLALLLVTQALFNMCVAVGLAPVTGQPLPLVSRGGTSTIINCVYIGVILSISRSAKKKEQLLTQPEDTEPAMAFAK
ncbi:MAG: FtsW/RodA/SpoVE family cell cycle protein [Prevotella sp.]|uniref:FtsW/RodA/SpoVE family cell cycle protein n=1 Tax=Prevotella sp. P3-122 TaxID=2024223 RepID=UPI000B95FAAE|nr:FtsW/RodA/SpoVE family cell cycle protein [Prevotella sp. P3-122]MCI6308881.1 FtsW/RodA/SpoVE family cell cycle protein [Prevotella sp.]MCI6501228.1 FtsW/RodA/SpoVE family cell cycle protein [Prevotella sp.]MCI7360015.1 FtsW/RodA/SpoVE family cell cycle protein [Prevotella sp.]MDD6590722.1 FtsW/RodA/SpoVE family cell cycle protein [Prevotella sp.]MDD6671629.1 FtsW/RodA/SpoVE family cell cycle protein [Prevotella sp.]